MSDDMNNRGPEDYKFILGQEREFGYGPITGEDNVDHLVYLAAAMGLTTSDIHELTVFANEAGMSLVELLAILATMSDLLAVISAPILPPITVHIIDTGVNTDDTVNGTIDEMYNTGTRIPMVFPLPTYRVDTDDDTETHPGLVLEPPTLNSGHSAMREIADKVVDRQSFDELAARRRAQRSRRFDEMRSGKACRGSENTVPSHMHRSVPSPFNTTAFVKGMVRRSMLFGQLIALGNMTPAVDADPDAMRAADMDLFDPYTEGPDTTDPAS